MMQFGSRQQHCAVDAVVTLVHHVQSTRAAGHVGALILFDISGFFDNIHPGRAAEILCLKGFPTSVCTWVRSFLTDREVTIKVGDYSSQPFSINYGTPQGSPLSPILSALYTSIILTHTETWRHKELTLYVDDGAIYATSATIRSATKAAKEGLQQVISWLTDVGLAIDPVKMEFMIFKPRHSTARLHGTDVTHITINGHSIKPVTTLRYLGVHIHHRLNWEHHVNTRANRARSTIRGISILGNSIRGLDFMNWRRVYNAIVVSILTYGTPVWFTGIG